LFNPVTEAEDGWSDDSPLEDEADVGPGEYYEQGATGNAVMDEYFL
jgi:hypothetical protein